MKFVGPLTSGIAGRHCIKNAWSKWESEAGRRRREDRVDRAGEQGSYERMEKAGNGTGIRKDALKRSRLKKRREDDDRNKSRWVLDGKGERLTWRRVRYCQDLENSKF